jgi:hypothetical protein
MLQSIIRNTRLASVFCQVLSDAAYLRTHRQERRFCWNNMTGVTSSLAIGTEQNAAVYCAYTTIITGC